ncbi:MAG: hypothetical protein ABI651_10390 [Verrucomicrobiota bacterium]
MKTIHHTLSALALLALMFTQGLAQSIYEPYTFTTLAGGGGFASPDVPGSAGRLNLPFGIATDSAGNVYVTDQFSSTIRKVTPAGVVTEFAGRAGSFGSADGTGNAAQFRAPQGVAVDSATNICVADTWNNLIRKVRLVGTNWVTTTLAHRPVVDWDNGGSEDGSGMSSTSREVKAVECTDSE